LNVSRREADGKVYTGPMPKRPYLLIFLISAAFFSFVHAAPGFGDPDAYYHLEMAKLTAAKGPVTEFPWLPFTTLADRFADHHFLYHAALAPFVLAFGDFLGLKAATIVFAALAMTAFARLLHEYGVKRPFLWSLTLPFASGFVFRLLLTKATALALAALFLYLIALRRRNRLAAFAIAFAYVWLHGGWPILLAVAGLDALVRRSPRLVWPTALGLAAGLVVNPFFPANLSFYWEQIVQIAVVGRRDAAVPVGNEWYAPEFAQLFIGNAPAFFPLAAGIAALSAGVWMGARSRTAPTTGRRKDIVFVASLATLFLLMTLRQARHKEYFLPFAAFAGALIAETAAEAVGLRTLAARARSRLGRAWIPALASLAAALALFGAYELWLPWRAFQDRPEWTRFEGAAAWTRAHVPEGETVFHVRWDDFPQLFYRDPSHRYIAGLDPLFLYRKDPERYWLWRDIGDGRRRDGLPGLLERGFEARYVLLRTEPGPLLSILRNDPAFEQVYADDEAEIWRVR